MERLHLFVHIYFVTALAYNILGQVWLDAFGKKFSSTDPITGIQVISLVYMIFMLRDLLPEPGFVVLMAVWLAAIARFGIFQHLLNYSDESYLSRGTWIAAIAINLFGVLLLAALLFTALTG